MSLPIDVRSINSQSLFYDPTMDNNIHRSSSNSPSGANHLCVLVHGLWGNTQHLKYIAESLREKYGEDELVILSCKTNASFFTYDGIEVGAERVSREIEETTKELAKDGYNITKFSIVGYSLGGLFARYAVGLLDHSGYFDHIQPINFTTFASPHLGVRTPRLGYANHVWNVLGARTLSASGRQLFGIDNFRGTGRPLLSVLADPDSVFIHALARFKRRCLYANIINDRTAVYYTTGISATDPYVDLEKIKLRYVHNYEPVILDPDRPYERIDDEGLPTFFERVKEKSKTFLRRSPIYVALACLAPIGITAILINSGIQTFRSQRRIMLHEKDVDGQGFGVYRIPLLRDVRARFEETFEATNSAQGQDHLPQESEETASDLHQVSTGSSLISEKTRRRCSKNAVRPSDQSSAFPTLALTPGQFAMIKALDDVGFRKYPVYIHNSSHSHAAIIVRSSRSAFDEGKTVIKHWLKEEFQI